MRANLGIVVVALGAVLATVSACAANTGGSTGSSENNPDSGGNPDGGGGGGDAGLDTGGGSSACTDFVDAYCSRAFTCDQWKKKDCIDTLEANWNYCVGFPTVTSGDMKTCVSAISIQDCSAFDQKLPDVCDVIFPQPQECDGSKAFRDSLACSGDGKGLDGCLWYHKVHQDCTQACNAAGMKYQKCGWDSQDSQYNCICY